MRVGIIGAPLAAVAIVALVVLGGDSQPERVAAPTGAPNLLVVMTDDQALGTFTPEVMPRTIDFFADGTTFTEAVAAPPLCCPARAGFLTGRYAHNHGVVENEVGYGTLRDPEATLATALQDGGYRTGLIGKFLNGYEAVAGAEPAPGFDHWYAIHGYADYFDFEVSDGGKLREVAEYATSDLTRDAIDFTRAAHADGAPFFLWLAYNAPHTVLPAYPPPCDGTVAQPPSAEAFERFADVPLPESPSFGSAGVGERPSLVDGPGELRAGRIEEATKAWRCALASLAAVDDGFAELIESLRASGELERTVVVFLSDNGHFYGEHRITDDKGLPLDPALRIPLAVRVGDEVGQRPPAELDQLVSQVDLAPTLLDYAGQDPCSADDRCPTMDGRSLRGLLEGGDEGWPRDRAIPLKLNDGWTYRALRSPTELLIEVRASRWNDFARPPLELYDLRADPDQLVNLMADPAADTVSRAADLYRRLRSLARCVGVRGREPGGARPYCE